MRFIVLIVTLLALAGPAQAAEPPPWTQWATGLRPAPELQQEVDRQTAWWAERGVTGCPQVTPWWADSIYDSHGGLGGDCHVALLDTDWAPSRLCAMVRHEVWHAITNADHDTEGITAADFETPEDCYVPMDQTADWARHASPRQTARLLRQEARRAARKALRKARHRAKV